jgi:hypothetical protein
VLLPDADSSVTTSADSNVDDSSMPCLRDCKRDATFTSDLLQYVSMDDLLKTVCYRDIELFVIKNPDRGSDVLCAIIEFRNLKGMLEGGDG